MTIEKYIKNWLFEACLWEDECDKIFIELQEKKKDSNIRWNDSIDGYSEPLKSVILYAARQVAISWLKANVPQHIALFVLEDETK
jgi:hypothetical protein